MNETKTITGHVRDAGGGVVEIVVDADTDFYPPDGAKATIEYVEPSRFYTTAAPGRDWHHVWDRERPAQAVATFRGPGSGADATEYRERRMVRAGLTDV